MRPSCQSAKPWPCSAAYCSDITARVFSPVLSASVALRIASTGDIASVGACGGGAVQRIPHLLGVFPDVTGRDVAFVRFPGLAALRKLGVGDLHIQDAFDGV